MIVKQHRILSGKMKDFYTEFDHIMLKAAEENKEDYNTSVFQ
jgi:hypothetical protein